MTRVIGLAIVTALCASACAPAATGEGSGSVPEMSNASSASTEPSPSASGSPVADSLNVVWSEQEFDGDIAAVIADGSQFVAVGAEPSLRAAWTSTDGLSWTQHAVPDPAPSNCTEPYDPICFPNSAGMGQMVRLGDTIYSIGTTFSFNDYLRPVGWRWTDGQAWQAIQSDSPFYEYGWLVDLTASDNALVAIKYGPTNFTSNAWRWTFETSWIASELAGTFESPIDLIDTAWGHGTYLAVGTTAEPVADVGPEQWPTSVAMWSSDDGLAWAPIDPPPGAAGLCSVTATAGGFIVSGSTDMGSALWLSPDASEWVQVDLASPADATPDPYTLVPSCSVTEVGGGFLATRGMAQGTLTWLSSNGTEWTAGPTLDVRTGPDQIAAIGDTVVLAGRQGGPDPAEAATPVLFVGSVQP